MLIFREKVKNKFEYPLKNKVDLDQTIYFDIETTGLSRKYCSIYLIGAMYYQDGEPYVIQWFAENINDEANVIMAFHKFLAKYKTIIQFNGNTFDIPFVKERSEKFNIEFDFDSFNHLDLYHSFKPLKKLLKLDSLKQKSFETYLGINRIDKFSGGELIDTYKEYVRTKNEKLLFPLLLHNYEDVEYMGHLTELFFYTDLLDGDFFVDSFGVNQYLDYNNKERQELTIIVKHKLKIPREVIFTSEDIYIKISDGLLILKVQALEETLKLFHKDYKNYYYLTKEDKALHKSVTQYVDSAYREQAKASTCYEKIDDLFVPLFDGFDYDYTFKKEYSDKSSFIRIKDLHKTNIKDYVLSIINHIL